MLTLQLNDDQVLAPGEGLDRLYDECRYDFDEEGPYDLEEEIVNKRRARFAAIADIERMLGSGLASRWTDLAADLRAAWTEWIEAVKS